MKPELRRKLTDNFPDIFPARDPMYPKPRPDKDGKTDPVLEAFHRMPFQIDVDDGWYDLLYNLCTEIQAILDTDKSLKEYFYASQVKEKFAGLRFYISGAPQQIHDLIHEAENKSYTICERCGEPGIARRRGGWYKTLCKECAGDEWIEAKWE